MTPEALKEILEKHKLWRIGDPAGARANLAGADLVGADLVGANLVGANFADAYLARADLAGAYLARADLAGAYLARANLAGANLAGADLARANLADAYLAGAYLARAYLAGADLAGADLAGANLAGANLAGANLAGADLAGADLADADLAGADLADADLADAYLARADLAGANLAGANLAGANLAGADLADAYLARARYVPVGIEKTDPPEPYQRVVDPASYAKRAERYRARHPNVPVVPDLDRRMLDVIESGASTLDMSQWHVCETTHCRAGWAITFAGEAGKRLEEERGPAMAGHMIYLASTGRSAHFYATTERAMEDIRARAAEAAAGTQLPRGMARGGETGVTTKATSRPDLLRRFSPMPSRNSGACMLTGAGNMK
jgi:uncharacterized protein YjbI with pentapeptide repeats